VLDVLRVGPHLKPSDLSPERLRRQVWLMTANGSHVSPLQPDAAEELRRHPSFPAFPAEAVVGLGRGSLVVSMFGIGWLGWGIGLAKAFNEIAGTGFGVLALSLWGCSVYFIRKGRLLRKRFPSPPASARRAILRSFLLVVLLEVLAIALVVIVGGYLRRPDLATDWCAMVVGLHLLPLAKIFRAPFQAVFGVLITVWCFVAWALFRSNALVISVAIGTGLLLCGTAAWSLWNARRIAESLH
jgi:hypothetical protein